MIDLDALTIDQVQSLAAENGWRPGVLRATGKTAHQHFARDGKALVVFYAEGRIKPLARLRACCMNR
jgi:hypothetical protein